MWIFNKDGFFSAVAHRDKPDHVMVRARRKEDIEALARALGAEAELTPNADYAYRVTVPKSDFADYMQASVLDLDYPNFKSACAGYGARSQAYHDVWTVMNDFQAEARPYESPEPAHSRKSMLAGPRSAHHIDFPYSVTEIEWTCALRFDGYKYEEAVGLDDAGGGFSLLVDPIVETRSLHEDPLKNFAAFFALQRFLHKWGGEHYTKYSQHHIAYDFLFLECYRRDVPAEFVDAEYQRKWQGLSQDEVEAAAAFVRNSFRRKGFGHISAYKTSADEE